MANNNVLEAYVTNPQGALEGVYEAHLSSADGLYGTIVEAPTLEGVSEVLVSEDYGRLQPAYGVSIQHQPKYGVPIGTIQPAYGVQLPIGTIQPAYGVIAYPGINISISQIEENIATLKKSISNLRSSWDGETKKDINILDNSWVGEDCKQYTQRLTKMDTKVQNTIAALELLCKTYEQVRDLVKDNQNKSLNAVNNIE